MSPKDSAAKKPTHAEEVRLGLANQIISGQLLPGTRLDEVEQARHFGYSRTPVREAFRQLAALGLVQNRPHRGVIVTPLSRRLVVDLYETCAEIMVACVQLAAIRMTDRQCEALRAVEGDDGVVRLIQAGIHNDVLSEVAGGVWVRLQPFLPKCAMLNDVRGALAGRDDLKAAQLVRHRLREMCDRVCANLPEN